MANNQITSLQEVLIRRVNRQLKIERRGNKLHAVLPLKYRAVNGQVETETHSRSLTIEATPDGFRAVMFTKTFWKRTYWRKWRERKDDEICLESANFLRLVTAIKENIG